MLLTCSYDKSSGNFGGILQLIKFSKTSKLIKIARIVRIIKIVRLSKVLNLLKKIEARFVMVRLTAFKLISILGVTFIMAHLFGCLFIFFATLEEDNYYTNSWVFSSGQSVQLVKLLQCPGCSLTFMWALIPVITLAYIPPRMRGVL